METLPKDLVTKIMLMLCNNDRLAVMAVFPSIPVNWQLIYQHRNTPLQKKLKEIVCKHFPYSTADRMEAANEAYQWLDTTKDYNELEYRDEFYDHCDIPIDTDNSMCYKLEDYRYNITDVIYKEIYDLKKEMNQ